MRIEPGSSLIGRTVAEAKVRTRYGVTLVAKTAELAIKLRKQGMFKVSRRSNYVKPPEKALKEFLEQG